MLSSFAYTYDQGGNRTVVQELTGAPVTYTYDVANQLINEYRFNSFSGTMTYDGVGNRTVFNDGGSRTTYTYDAADQLTSSINIGTTTNYTNDENGNLLTQVTGTSRTTQTWDDENRLTKWERQGTTTNDYAFNGDGQRTRIVDSVSPSGRRLIWDAANILLETDDAGATQGTYTLEPASYGNLISQRRSTTSSYHLFDALGSTDRLMDSAGTTALNTYQYRASGLIVSSTGSTVNPFRWVGSLGYYYDANRLAYYVRARTYSPAFFRWLSRDPIGFAGRDGNLYRYVENRTTIAVDPMGLCEMRETQPCEIKIFAGHHGSAVPDQYGNDPVEYWLKKNYKNESGTNRGVYVGIISCYSDHHDAGYEIESNQKIPGFPEFKKKLIASHALQTLNTAISNAKELGIKLCDNRINPANNGGGMGVNFSDCDTVTITVTCDTDMNTLMTTGIGPNGQPVFKPTNWTKSICGMKLNMNCTDDKPEWKPVK